MSYDHMLLFNTIALTLQGSPCCSLSDLSRELQISRHTIQNTVKAVTGKKFRDLREELLLARVKKLLVSGPGTTIKRVALEVGYRSTRSFSRAVRRACGASPTQLRTRITKKLPCRKSRD